jgi:hypothetical protein
MMIIMGFHDTRYLGLDVELDTIIGSFFCLGFGMGFGRDEFGNSCSSKYTRFALYSFVFLF